MTVEPEAEEGATVLISGQDEHLEDIEATDL